MMQMISFPNLFWVSIKHLILGLQYTSSYTMCSSLALGIDVLKHDSLNFFFSFLNYNYASTSL